MNERGDGRFATTRWSAVLAVGTETTTTSRASLESLCEAHRFSVYVRNPCTEKNIETARDLAQSFFHQLLQNRSDALFERAWVHNTLSRTMERFRPDQGGRSREEKIMKRFVWGAVLALLAAAPAYTAEPGPRIVLDPDTAKSGEKVTVSGFGFCGDEGCSLVRIEIEEEVVAGEIEVGPDGNFAVSIEPTAPPGLHDVIAFQEIGPGGEKIESVAELILGVGEQKPGGRRPIPR
jgi:hypothetical protein